MRLRELAKINEKKYLYPPTWSQIQSFIDELGVSLSQFEKFYFIPHHMMCQVKSGAKKFPKYAWGYIFEKIKPTYGIGFLEEHIQTETIKRKLKNRRRKKKKKLQPINTYTHDRLADVK